jgi:hypothetical protein
MTKIEKQTEIKRLKTKIADLKKSGKSDRETMMQIHQAQDLIQMIRPSRVY